MYFRSAAFATLTLCASLAGMGLGFAANAEEAPPALRPGLGPAAAQVKPRPLFLAKSSQLQPAVIMARAENAEPAEIDAIAQWNAAGLKPTKTGFFRSLPVPQKALLDARLVEKDEVDLDRAIVRKTESDVLWATRLRVEGAWGLRARLSNVRLPSGTQLWVYGEGESSIHFGRELIRPDGDLWTPAVGGEELSLEIRVPRTALEAGEELSFEIRRVAQLFQLDTKGAPLSGSEIEPKFCTEGAACWGHPNPAFDIMKNATSHMQTVKDEGVFICSGTLMNDTVSGGFIPYLLTANHCLDNQNHATSTTFYFDFIPSACGGFDPFFFNLPQVNGATLLATRPASDSSFLRLFSEPDGLRGYAGWTTGAPAVGELLRSFSHPNGRSMRYSETEVIGGSGCGFSSSEFIFSDQVLGGVQGGSSGSHVFDEDFRVVGQLLGACGSDPSNGCFWSSNNRVDGRFASFYPFIRQWLDPSAPAGCTENATTLCLNGDRFEVTSSYRAFNGESGPGRAVELTNDTGYFWFFSSTNVEVVLKVLDACGLNNHFWVFAGGLTNVDVGLTVRDTATGRTWTGRNNLGQAFRTITDTTALACN